jgi:hypothetical protein
MTQGMLRRFLRNLCCRYRGFTTVEMTLADKLICLSPFVLSTIVTNRCIVMRIIRLILTKK